MKLWQLLEELECPYDKLHNAGNDAYFTLRVLLLLAIRGYADKVNARDDHKDKLAVLEAITSVDIPTRDDLAERKNRKRLKRQEKARKLRKELMRYEQVERRLKRKNRCYEKEALME